MKSVIASSSHAGVVLQIALGVHDKRRREPRSRGPFCSARAPGPRSVPKSTLECSADAELLAQYTVRLEESLVHVVDDTPFRMLGKRFQVEVPLPLGIETRLGPLGPKYSMIA